MKRQKGHSMKIKDGNALDVYLLRAIVDSLELTSR